MPDIKNSPYAPWLEELIGQILEHQPVRIGLCAMLPDGNVLTGYYGEPGHQDKAVMGYHLTLDAVHDTILANAGSIVAAAQEDDCADETE